MAAKTPRTTLVLHAPEISLHVFHCPEDGGGEAVNGIVLETSQSLLPYFTNAPDADCRVARNRCLPSNPARIRAGPMGRRHQTLASAES